MRNWRWVARRRPLVVGLLKWNESHPVVQLIDGKWCYTADTPPVKGCYHLIGIDLSSDKGW